MTRKEAMQIISEEDLKNYNLNEDRPNVENELGIKKCDDRWIVYVTDERASIITGSEAAFDAEEDAWDNFIKRLRAHKIWLE